MNNRIAFRESERISGELLYVDDKAFKLLDVKQLYSIVVPNVSETQVLDFVPHRLLVSDHYIYIDGQIISYDVYCGHVLFGNLLVVFYKKQGITYMIKSTGSPQQEVIGVDVQAVRQYNPFAAVLSWNDENNSIVSLLPIQAFTPTFNPTFGNSFSIFPKTSGHELFNDNKTVWFSTDLYTAFLEVITEPFPLLRTVDYLPYKVRFTEYFPNYSTLLPNATLINEISKGFLFDAPLLEAFVYFFPQTKSFVFGKKTIPVSSQYAVEIFPDPHQGNTTFNIYKLELFPKTVPIKPIKRMFVARYSFPEAVEIVNVGVDFKYISNHEAPIKLIVDTSYNKIARDFVYMIHPDRKIYPIGVLTENLVITIISETGGEFDGWVEVSSVR